MNRHGVAADAVVDAAIAGVAGAESGSVAANEDRHRALPAEAAGGDGAHPRGTGSVSGQTARAIW